jgi:FLVCR family feline leukemia virus subgroup C receptor-related protein
MLRAFTSLESFMDLITFSMFIGVSWAYMVVIAVLLAPYNYTVEQIGYVSIVYAATGTVGGTLASIYVDY